MEEKTSRKEKNSNSFINITSKFKYFEIFTKKKLKCDINIPSTILLDPVSGNFKFWFINSKREKLPYVLMRNTDKLQAMEVAKYFTNIKMDENYESLLFMRDHIKDIPAYNKPLLYSRRAGKESKVMSAKDLISMLMEKNSSTLYMMQHLLKFKTPSNESFYCEMRRDHDTLPMTFKFYKKAIVNKPENKLKKSEEDKQSWEEDSSLKRKVFKSFDGNLNTRIQQVEYRKTRVQIIIYLSREFGLFEKNQSLSEITENLLNVFLKLSKKLIEFIELGYRLKVRRLTTSFIVDSENQLYYIANYDINQAKTIIGTECDFEVMHETIKDLKFSKNKPKDKITMNQGTNLQPISQKLLKNLLVETCQGDFCEYVLAENNQGVLSLRKNIMDEYKKHFGDKFSKLNMNSVTLPFEISNQLILRVREESRDIIALLKKNRIFLRSSNQFFMQENNQLDESTEYPFKNKRKDVDNIENLYKRVKICKACFIVYSLATKHFDISLRKELRTYDLNNSLKNSSTDIPTDVSIHRTTGSVINTDRSKSSSVRENRAITADREMDLYRKRYRVAILSRERINRYSINSNEIADARKSSVHEDRIKEEKREGSITMIPSIIPKKATIGTKEVVLSKLSLGFLNYDRVKKLTIFEAKNIMEKEELKKFCDIDLLDVLNSRPKSKSMDPNRQSSAEMSERKKTRINKNSSFETITNEKSLYTSYKKGEISAKKLKQSIKEKAKDNPNQQLKHTFCTYHYSTNFSHLRRNFKFQYASTMHSFLDEHNFPMRPAIDLSQFCQTTGYSPPPELDRYKEKNIEMQFYVHDRFTAISYTVLRSPISKQETPKKVLLFMPDIFESYMEYMDMFIEIMEASLDTTLIMSSYPGQAYTLFKKDELYDNFKVALIMDSLLHQLNMDGVFDIESDKFGFIGVGFGGFYIQTLLIQSDNTIKNFERVLFFNSFSEIDSTLETTLTKSFEVFESCPAILVELPYNYYSVIVNSQEVSKEALKQKIDRNPIKIEGRLSLIKGAQESYFIKDRFERVPISKYIVHSLKNCVVNINHVDQLLRYTTDERFNNLAMKISIINMEESLVRKSFHVKGGHSILEENPGELKEHLTNFFQN